MKLCPLGAIRQIVPSNLPREIQLFHAYYTGYSGGLTWKSTKNDSRSESDHAEQLRTIGLLKDYNKQKYGGRVNVKTEAFQCDAPYNGWSPVAAT